MGRQIRLEGAEVDVHEWWSTLVAREHRQVPDFLECERRRSLVTTCRVELDCRTNVTEIIKKIIIVYPRTTKSDTRTNWNDTDYRVYE